MRLEHAVGGRAAPAVAHDAGLAGAAGKVSVGRDLVGFDEFERQRDERAVVELGDRSFDDLRKALAVAQPGAACQALCRGPGVLPGDFGLLAPVAPQLEQAGGEVVEDFAGDAARLRFDADSAWPDDVVDQHGECATGQVVVAVKLARLLPDRRRLQAGKRFAAARVARVLPEPAGRRCVVGAEHGKLPAGLLPADCGGGRNGGDHAIQPVHAEKSACR